MLADGDFDRDERLRMLRRVLELAAEDDWSRAEDLEVEDSQVASLEPSVPRLGTPGQEFVDIGAVVAPSGRGEFHDVSKKIARPVVNKVKKADADHFMSDCPMAASQIAEGLELKHGETNPLSLLRKAYGI